MFKADAVAYTDNCVFLFSSYGVSTAERIPVSDVVISEEDNGCTVYGHRGFKNE